MTENYVDLGAIATLLNVSKDTIRRRAITGDIPAVKVGQQWRFLESEVRDHLRRQSEMRDPWARSPASRRALNRRRAA
jgi:excisionase family DNA binding protein